MKKLLGLLLLLLPALLCFAGDTLALSSADTTGFIDWAILNWKEVALIIIAFLEFLLRMLPTEYDYSLIHFLLKVINFLVPNKAKKKSDGNYRFEVTKVRIPEKI